VHKNLKVACSLSNACAIVGRNFSLIFKAYFPAIRAGDGADGWARNRFR